MSILRPMEGFVKLGKVEEFPRDRARRCLAGGLPVAVFREGAGFVVTADTCPHMGASLAEGKLDAGRVVCSRHAWAFDARTGESDSRTGAVIDVYEARVVGGELWVKPPEPRPQAAPLAEEDEIVLFDPDQHLRKRPPSEQG